MSEKFERLFNRAEAILAGRLNGFGMPILRTLAHKGYGPAMLSIACRMTEAGRRAAMGRFINANSPVGLMYRAFRQGEVNAAQNLALTLFSVGDLAGYRQWLRRAAKDGDGNAARELSRFEVRQPYPLARRINRIRPFRRDER